MGCCKHVAFLITKTDWCTIQFLLPRHFLQSINTFSYDHILQGNTCNNNSILQRAVAICQLSSAVSNPY